MIGKLLLKPGLLDAHLHLDDHCHAKPGDAVHSLISQMNESGIQNAIVLHLAWQPWTLTEFGDALRNHSRLIGFANVNPVDQNAPNVLQESINLGFHGVKLHPRRQGYLPDSSACIKIVREAGAAGLPVIIDCFPDGNWIMDGLTLLQYATLARESPDTKIVVAHAAGHRCLDLLMLMKRVGNLWCDLSYSMLYYRESSVLKDLLFCMKSLRGERIMFGTDFPDRPLKPSVEMMQSIISTAQMETHELENILWKNAHQLLQASLV